MADEQRELGQDRQPPIQFARHLAGSDAFRAMFREGMALVEETADYLDGAGREESKALNRVGSLAYATESMRLTTRLMQMASWLLLQRAVNNGEMSPAQAAPEKAKVKLTGLATATEGSGWDELPERLRTLILRSIQLQERLRRLDEAMNAPDASPNNDNPVARQIGEIARAFRAATK